MKMATLALDTNFSIYPSKISLNSLLIDNHTSNEPKHQKGHTMNIPNWLVSTQNTGGQQTYLNIPSEQEKLYLVIGAKPARILDECFQKTESQRCDPTILIRVFAA